MQGLTEKLELMQWLHGQGLPNDQWTGTDGHIYFDNTLEAIRLMAEGREKNGNTDAGETDTTADLYTPWFTLGRVLELLPKTIDLSPSKEDEPFDLIYLGIFDNEIGYGYGGNDWNEDLVESINGDIHLAGLKLLKQVLSEGRE